jgi:Fic family protein
MTADEKIRRKIIAAMRWGREYTSGDLEQMTGIKADFVTRQMTNLRNMGLVERTGAKDRIKFYALKREDKL